MVLLHAQNAAETARTIAEEHKFCPHTKEQAIEIKPNQTKEMVAEAIETDRRGSEEED